MFTTSDTTDYHCIITDTRTVYDTEISNTCRKALEGSAKEPNIFWKGRGLQDLSSSTGRDFVELERDQSRVAITLYRETATAETHKLSRGHRASAKDGCVYL